ncbi:hypothetical protein LCGC14_2837190, partial [marine sediment metagenome]
MHTRTLSRADTPCWRSSYFRTNDFRPWLCTKLLRHHVELPAECTKVRLVSTEREPLSLYPNYWDLKQDGRLIGVRT